MQKRSSFWLMLLIPLIGCIPVLGDSTTNDPVAAILVDIYKGRKSQTWVEQKLSSVLDREDITKLVLLRAETSAPGRIDALNVWKALDPNQYFIQPPTVEIIPTYQAVVITKQDHVFYVLIGGGFMVIRSADGWGMIKASQPPPGN